MSKEHVRAALLEAHSALEKFLQDEAGLEAVDRAADLMASSIASGGRIYSCGNGGSLCDAMHFAEEMTGRYRKDRRAYAATAIADASHIACVANDNNYEFVFSRYVEAHGHPGDVLLAISTSGTSKNVLAAVRSAKALGEPMEKCEHCGVFFPRREAVRAGGHVYCSERCRDAAERE